MRAGSGRVEAVLIEKGHCGFPIKHDMELIPQVAIVPEIVLQKQRIAGVILGKQNVDTGVYRIHRCTAGSG